MKMKYTVSGFVSFVITAFLALAGAQLAEGQGRYVGQYSRTDVSNIIRRMEENSDEFRTDFRREINNSNLNSSTRNRYNGYVASMENSVDDLRRHFDRNDNWWVSRSRVQTVVRNSQNVNNMMRSLPFQRQLERQWNQLRNQINRVADTYDLPGLDGGGWHGGPWNPGNPNPGPGWGNRPPTWLVGTWYWTAGNNRMTIQSNGNIDAYNEGQHARGSYRNGTLVFSNGTATYARVGNNLRTTNQTNGMTLDWSRNPYSGGGGNVNRPPNWAIGQWRALREGGLTMSVQYDGQVVVTNNGRFYRGTWYNNSITVDGATSTMSSSGRNRMRGRNTSNGVIVDWVRNN